MENRAVVVCFCLLHLILWILCISQSSQTHIESSFGRFQPWSQFIQGASYQFQECHIEFCYIVDVFMSSPFPIFLSLNLFTPPFKHQFFDLCWPGGSSMMHFCNNNVWIKRVLANMVVWCNGISADLEYIQTFKVSINEKTNQTIYFEFLQICKSNWTMVIDFRK